MAASLAEQLKQKAVQYADRRGAFIDKVLGEGGSAAVYRMNKGGDLWALKVYAPKFFDGANDPAERRRVELQRQLRAHSCSSLIGLFDLTEAEGTCFLEMDMFPSLP
jgi:eukaryotic-like serine/threonine-protein kinase